MNGIHEVSGSIPLGSTNPVDELDAPPIVFRSTRHMISEGNAIVVLTSSERNNPHGRLAGDVWCRFGPMNDYLTTALDFEGGGSGRRSVR